MLKEDTRKELHVDGQEVLGIFTSTFNPSTCNFLCSFSNFFINISMQGQVLSKQRIHLTLKQSA
jgi:hypothetical protein